MILINSRTKEFHSVSDCFRLSIPSSFCVDDWNPYCFPQQQQNNKKEGGKKKAKRNRPVEESGVDSWNWAHFGFAFWKKIFISSLKTNFLMPEMTLPLTAGQTRPSFLRGNLEHFRKRKEKNKSSPRTKMDSNTSRLLDWFVWRRRMQHNTRSI